ERRWRPAIHERPAVRIVAAGPVEGEQLAFIGGIWSARIGHRWLMVTRTGRETVVADVIEEDAACTVAVRRHEVYRRARIDEGAFQTAERQCRRIRVDCPGDFEVQVAGTRRATGCPD